MVISNKNKTFFLYLRCNPRYESDGGSEDEERPEETTSMKRPQKTLQKTSPQKGGPKQRIPPPPPLPLLPTLMSEDENSFDVSPAKTSSPATLFEKSTSCQPSGMHSTVYLKK